MREWQSQFLFPDLALSKSPKNAVSSYLKALGPEVPSATYAAFEVHELHGSVTATGTRVDHISGMALVACLQSLCSQIRL